MHLGKKSIRVRDIQIRNHLVDKKYESTCTLVLETIKPNKIRVCGGVF